MWSPIYYSTRDSPSRGIDAAIFAGFQAQSRVTGQFGLISVSFSQQKPEKTEIQPQQP